MKLEYSKSRQKGMHAVKSGKERVFIDGIWSMEIPTGYSYCAEYDKTATDINGNHYRLQVQKTDSCDFSSGYGSEVSLTVRDQVIEFNNYTTDARDAKEIIMQVASMMGSVEMIKEDKTILVAINTSIFISGNYSFYVIIGGRNVLYQGQITFADDTGLNEAEIAKSFVKSIEPVLIKDLATGEGLARLPNSYLPDFDTGKYLDVDNSFRVPIPEGYETKYDLSAQIKAAVIPKNAVFTSTGVRCKVGFVMYQDPINAGTGNTRSVIDAIKKFFVEQTGINFYNWPITTVRDTSKGTIVYSTITNTPCDQNTNPFLVVTGGKAYHCFIVITYDGPISDECDTKWDADIITTAWLSKILFKGEKKPNKTKGNDDVFEKAFPDKSLYPHYDHLMNAAPKIPGAVVIVNQNGTEYAFYDLKKASDPNNDEFGDEQKALFSRIVAQDTDSYDLDQEARKMSAVFHVDPSIFDMRNDREAELVNGYMKRAYMFSALRSFGWTLSDYCGKKKKLPRDLSVKELKAIVDFIAKRNWLNYDAATYCKGLCAGADLHVFYVPDGISEDDKSELLPSQVDYDRIRQMKSISPSYYEILPDVQSLDALRGSLKFVYPAIKTLHDDLAKKRNHMKPLEGNESDIVYAWCALAMAAKEPFFTEDGPMSYFLSQPEHGDSSTKATSTETRGDVIGKHVAHDKYISDVDKWGFKISEIPTKQKKLIDNKTGYAVRFLPKSEVSCYVDEAMHYFQFYCFQHRPDFFDKIDELTVKARKYSKLLDEDSAKDVMNGKLRNTCPIHAIRSFVWTASEMQSDIFEFDAPLDMWLDLARFIGMHGYANYLPMKKTDKHFGSALLRKEEAPTIYTEDVMQVSSNYIVEDFWQIASKATSVSLFDLIDMLIKISPIMDKYYDYLVAGEENTNESEFSSNLIMILKGWSIYALACKQPFYIVPAKRCQIDINDDVSSWNKKAEVNEYVGGSFIAYGTSLVEINNSNEVITIPEGITDILLCDDTRDSLKNAVNAAKTIIYPSSYYGTIYVGSSTVDVIAKGNLKDLSICHINYVPYELTEQNYRLSYVEIDSVERIKQFSIPSFEGGLGIRINKWITELDDFAFDRSGTLKVWLPSKLSVVKDRVFYKNYDNYTTTVYVYEDCKLLPEIKKQIDSLNYVNLQVEEYPWVTWARSFVSKISLQYGKRDSNEITAEGINGILSDTFETLEKFMQSKERIITEASDKGLTGIVSIINDLTDDKEAFDRIPRELCADIRQSIEKRNLEEREKKLTEIKSLFERDSTSDLNKAIEIAEGIKKEDPRAGELIAKCIEKINAIKANKYAEANSLASEMTENSIRSAISIMRSISPFEDSESKISIWQKMLVNERLYLDSVSSMVGADIASLTKVKASFESLGNYKDSCIKAAACEKYLSELCEKKYLEAKEAQAVCTVDSQTLAIAAYNELGDYKDALERIAICTSNITVIQEMLDLEEQLGRYKEELKSLTGFFKRRQREEKEALINRVEQQIAELKDRLEEVN